MLLWTIDLIDDTNKNGSMEFVVPACDADTFFPVDVHFSATKTLCDIRVTSVTHVASGAIPKYGLHTLLSTDGYQVA
jgi:coatomer subunit delta